jgi:hypothetical protein
MLKRPLASISGTRVLDIVGAGGSVGAWGESSRSGRANAEAGIIGSLMRLEQHPRSIRVTFVGGLAGSPQGRALGRPVIGTLFGKIEQLNITHS